MNAGRITFATLASIVATALAAAPVRAQTEGASRSTAPSPDSTPQRTPVDPAGGAVLPPSPQPGSTASAPAAQTPAEVASTPGAADQGQANQGRGIADIVVTAERRETNIQKTPLTIQVLGGPQVMKAGITEVAALSRVTTGVEIGQAGTNSQTFIRGVGDFSFNPLNDPGVAFNVDGVYVGRPAGVNGNFYDLSRVEILKGPQGTLYGRNANGGSINVITNEAAIGRRTFDLGLEGGNYKYAHATGAINLPIGDDAAIRAAFNVVQRNGYLSNGADDDIEQSARVRFKWKPNADVTLQLSADYSHLGGRGNDYVYKPQRPGASPYEAETEPAANTYLHSVDFLGRLTDSLQDNGFQRVNLYNVSGQLDWRLGNFATLTVLPAFRDIKSDYITHFAQQFTGRERTKQTSVEVRLGNSTPLLTWVAGAYFLRSVTPYPDSYIIAYASQALQNNRIVYAPKTTAYAGFGQATLRVVDGFRLIGGLRYTSEDRSVQGSITDLAQTPPAVIEQFSGARNFSGVTFKAGAEYDISPKSLLFATYSTGFKSGGFTQTIAPRNVYQPERLDAAEVGVRNRFFENRLQLNFGGFYWTYKNIQDARVNIDGNNIVNFTTFNAGNARLYGGNVDVIAKPTRADTISLAGEYDHARYTRFFFQTPAAFFNPVSNGCRILGPFATGATLPYSGPTGTTNTGPLPVVVGDCRGFQVARAPTWTGTLAYQHVFTLSDAATIDFDASAKYSSSSYLNIDFIPGELQKAYTVVDASLTYNSPDRRWSAALYVRNLTKTVYYTGGDPSGFVGGVFNGNIAPPRMFGGRLQFHFGE